MLPNTKQATDIRGEEEEDVLTRGKRGVRFTMLPSVVVALAFTLRSTVTDYSALWTTLDMDRIRVYRNSQG